MLQLDKDGGCREPATPRSVSILVSWNRMIARLSHRACVNSQMTCVPLPPTVSASVRQKMADDCASGRASVGVVTPYHLPITQNDRSSSRARKAILDSAAAAPDAARQKIRNYGDEMAGRSWRNLDESSLRYSGPLAQAGAWNDAESVQAGPKGSIVG